MDKKSFEKYLFYKKKYIKLLDQLGGNKCSKKSNIALLTSSQPIISTPEEVCLVHKEPTKLDSIYSMDFEKLYIPDVPDEKSPPHIKNLYERINEKFKIIIKEMIINGKKTDCWAWWVFPTEMPGGNEPPPRTNVTKEDAHFLFRSKRFIFIHEKIYELFLRKEKNNDEFSKIQFTFPRVDHGRIYYFIEFWKKDIEGKPNWFNIYLSILAKYYPNPKPNPNPNPNPTPKLQPQSQ